MELKWKVAQLRRIRKAEVESIFSVVVAEEGATGIGDVGVGVNSESRSNDSIGITVGVVSWMGVWAEESLSVAPSLAVAVYRLCPS